MEVDLGAAEDDYLARVVPEAGGSWLVAVLPRDQRSLRWLRVQPDGRATELWTEQSEPWLNVDQHTRALADGSILRSTERPASVTWSCERQMASCMRQLTEGDWVVTEVVHVDEARREVLFIGTADGPTERHLYAVSRDAAAPNATRNA